MENPAPCGPRSAPSLLPLSIGLSPVFRYAVVLLHRQKKKEFKSSRPRPHSGMLLRGKAVSFLCWRHSSPHHPRTKRSKGRDGWRQEQDATSGTEEESPAGCWGIGDLGLDWERLRDEARGWLLGKAKSILGGVWAPQPSRCTSPSLLLQHRSGSLISRGMKEEGRREQSERREV